MLSVFVRELEFVDEIPEGEKSNQIFLDGYICKEPIYRKTPLGREIADLLIAVNRSYGKSDYIPCICWGRNARYASGFEVGGHVQVFGRIQSREYVKKLSETEVEHRVAYEVSVSKIVSLFLVSVIGTELSVYPDILSDIAVLCINQTFRYHHGYHICKITQTVYRHFNHVKSLPKYLVTVLEVRNHLPGNCNLIVFKYFICHEYYVPFRISMAIDEV